ncbi:MAG: NINE protein [Treponema sp.]|jgi:TM2 domain-containing membrane protein YozV/predicted transcriptional regulator|nr:NINE protein [Treponema sp.]
MYSVGLAYLLWLISGCGLLGFHRFYLGKIPTGLLWMFSGGLFGIGDLYDFFTLARQVEEANIRNAIFTGQGYSGQIRSHIRHGNARNIRPMETVERVILRLAKENKGILTASELALEANIPLETAKKNLDAMVSKGFVEIRVRKSGTLVYTMPELMDSDSPLEDF